MSRPAGTLRVRVSAKTPEATDICSVELRDAEGRALPSFTAGSHIDVHVGDGVTRPYSLCNDPAERDRYRIAVLREPNSRGGSHAMHALRVGDVLTIGEPRNHFPLVPGARRSLLLAGGIGITPILCMAQRLAATGADFALHYGARSRERAAFVERLARAPFASRVTLHLDDGDAAQRLELPALLEAPSTGTHLYVCGPAGFIDAVLATARAAGWADDRLHFERFSASVAPADRDASFEVTLARSGRVIVVPKGRTIVEALAEAGIEVPTSCEQGVCGTCLTGVLEGEPDHRDMVLTPQEQASNTCLLPCCSRSKTPRLVLDL